MFQYYSPYSVNASTINIPILENTFYTNTPSIRDNGQVTFEIDKRATIYLNLKNISEIDFEFISDGLFRISHLTAHDNKIEINTHLLMGKSIKKGKGRISFDYRRNFNWSVASTPVIYLQGTGKFIITKLIVETITDKRKAIKENNSALFWRPEVVRLSTINFLTPIYWNYNKKIEWTYFLGILYIASLFVLFIINWKIKKDMKRYVPFVSILFIFIFSSQFMIRFAPAVNWKFYQSPDEKIRSYYLRPEFGHLAASAKEIVKKGETIAIAVEKGDWFSPEAFCFNMLPAKCVFYDKDQEKFTGLGRRVVAQRNDIDIIAYYNFEGDVPDNFVKIYSLNKNVFIMRKK